MNDYFFESIKKTRNQYLDEILTAEQAMQRITALVADEEACRVSVGLTE